MAVEKPELNVSGEDLYEAAIADEQPASEEAKPETEAEPTKEEEGRQRDEKGRFVAKEEEGSQEPTEVKEEEEAQPAEESKPEPDHRIPLTELLNEREKRQRAESEREQARQAFAQLQRQLATQNQESQEPIDIFANPEAYQQSINQLMQTQRREMEGNFSLRLARATHKELFDEAWTEMVNRSMGGDDAMRQQVLNSSDPGETLVALYQQAKTYKEVNGDPNTWLETKKSEWMKDPQVQAQVLEMVKAQSGAQPQNTQVKLPPSLNKATAAAPSGNKVPMSDRELYEDAIRGS